MKRCFHAQRSSRRKLAGDDLRWREDLDARKPGEVWLVERQPSAETVPLHGGDQPLVTAYYLKDDPNQCLEQRSKATATRFLDSWLKDAERSSIQFQQKFAKTLA